MPTRTPSRASATSSARRRTAHKNRMRKMHSSNFSDESDETSSEESSCSTSSREESCTREECPSLEGKLFPKKKSPIKRQVNINRKRKERWAANRPADDPPFDYYYSLPDSKLLTLLVLVSIIIVVVLLAVFRCVLQPYLTQNTNNVIGTYIGVVGLPVGVILSFIVASAWGSFSNAQTSENEETMKIFALYELVGEYPVQGERIQLQIIDYTQEIVDNEFDIMAQGVQPQVGFQLLTAIGTSIYELNPTTPRESVLYSEAIDLYQEVQGLRITRMNYVSYGLAPELWWVLLLGVVLVIGMTYLLRIDSFLLHATLVAMVTATLVSLLFLIVAFNFPYRGDFGLDATPFETALAGMLQDQEQND